MMPNRIAKQCLIAFVGVSAVSLALAQAESSDPRRGASRQSRFQQPPADRAPASTNGAGDAPLPSRAANSPTAGRKPPTPGLQMPATWDNAPLESSANEPPLPKSKAASSNAKKPSEPSQARIHGEPTLADAAVSKLDPPPALPSSGELTQPTSSEASSNPSATADAPLPTASSKVTPTRSQAKPAAVAQVPTAAPARVEAAAKPTKKVGAKTPLQVVTESPTSTFGVRRPEEKLPAKKATRSSASAPVIEVAALPAERAPLVVAPTPQAVTSTPQIVAPSPLVIVPASEPARSDEVALEAPLPAALVVRPQVAAAAKPAAVKPATPTLAPTKPAPQPTAIAVARPEIAKQPTLAPPAPPAPQAVVSKPETTATPAAPRQPTIAVRPSDMPTLAVTNSAAPVAVVAAAPAAMPQPSPAPASRPAPVEPVKPTPALVVAPAVTPFVEVPTPIVAAAPAPAPVAQMPAPTPAPAAVVVSKPAPIVPKAPAPQVVVSSKPESKPLTIQTPESTTIAVARKPAVVVEETRPAQKPVAAQQPTLAPPQSTLTPAPQVARTTPPAPPIETKPATQSTPVRSAPPAPAAVATAPAPAAPTPVAAPPAPAAPAPVASSPAREPLSQPTEVAAAPAPAAPAATSRPAGPPQLASAQRMPVRPNLVLPAPISQAPAREQTVSSAEMNAVARLADARIRRGFELGTRGAMYSSRSEFMHALGMIAQALDAEAGSAIHMPAMTDGLRAIEESDDFVARNAQPRGDFDPVEVAARHRTPVLKGMEPGSISGIEALQRYYSYAQERLAFSVGHQPVGAMALHGLGKLHTSLARGQASQTVAAEPKALVYHQAALLVCPWNYMAANELGVLLVSYGRYEQAKAAFHQSLSVSRQPTTWRNLAVAHQSAGETELAKLALQEAEYAAAELKQRTGGTGLTEASPVQFVDVETFRKTGEGPGLSPAPQAAMSAAPPAATTRKASMETVAPAMRQ